MPRGIVTATGLCSMGEPMLLDAERQEIRQLIAAGLSYRHIGRVLDRDCTTVALAARRMGLASRHAIARAPR